MATPWPTTASNSASWPPSPKAPASSTRKPRRLASHCRGSALVHVVGDQIDGAAPAAGGDHPARHGAAQLVEQLRGRCGRAAQNNLDHRLGYVSPIVHPAQLPLFVDYGDHITIGDRTFINCNLTALDVAPIVIGADCQLGPSVQLLTPIHPIEPQPRRDKLEGGRPITLGDNVWLGGGVIVCPGVTIGDNTVVGAGSVVTRDLPANVIAVGNPARVLRSI